MPDYLVEVYSSAGSVGATALAVVGLGGGVSHVRSLYVPVDELSLHVVRGPSLEAVQRALERAALRIDRIVEVVEQGDSRTPTGGHA